MKKLYFLLFFLITSLSFGQVINEFEPNPNGTDPTDVSIELKGTPNTAFTGFILSIESDLGGSQGLVDRFTSVSGTFDANGLLVVSVPDLENPSLTLVLVSSFSGDNTTDIDTDDNGVVDDISTFGTIYDAIGSPDNVGDEASIYGVELGGSDFAYTGDEPRIIFRDGVTGDLFAVNDVTGDSTDEIYDITATLVSSSDFDVNPAIAPTFGSVNPVYTAPTEISLIINSPTEGEILAPTASISTDITFTVQNFNVASANGDGHIHYKVDNGNDIMKFDIDPITLTGLSSGAHSVYMELVDDNHTPISPAVNTTVNFSIATINQVATITDLRAGNEGEYYELGGEAIVTYTRTLRSQKYIEDISSATRGITSKTASGSGILIDDNAGAITTTYNVGDGMTGLKGRLSSFNGILQFVPLEDPGVASSTGNTVTPEVVTASELVTNWENYESELVEIKTASFVGATGDFVTSTNYTINDGTNDLTFRTNFSEADYIGTPIPTTAQNLVVLVGEFNGTPQVTARALADLTLRVERNTINGFSLYPNPVTNGKLTINTFSNADKEIQIFDILGKRILSTTLKGKELNVSTINSGIYILKILEEGKTATRKLVIK